MPWSLGKSFKPPTVIKIPGIPYPFNPTPHCNLFSLNFLLSSGCRELVHCQISVYEWVLYTATWTKWRGILARLNIHQLCWPESWTTFWCASGPWFFCLTVYLHLIIQTLQLWLQSTAIWLLLPLPSLELLINYPPSPPGFSTSEGTIRADCP